MTRLTAIAVIRISPGSEALVQVSLTWPLGDTENHTLNHDWSADTWNWRGMEIPTSLGRLLNEKLVEVRAVRAPYTSPSDVGTGTNEAGRVMVYEIDYEG